MSEKRKYPRYAYQEIVAIYEQENGDFVGSALMQNISVKGAQIVSQEELKLGKGYLFVFGYKGGKRIDLSTQILARYIKEGMFGYSALFNETVLSKEWLLLSYLEDIGLGKI